MKIDIHGAKLDLTPSIKKFIEDKIKTLEKLISRFEKEGEQIIFIEIARTSRHHRHGDVFYAEATIELPGKRVVRAEAFDSDARVAINSLKGILKNELIRYKEEKSEKQKNKKI